MSRASRSFEAWEKRKCRAKIKYHSWPDAERISRLNTTREWFQIFKIYSCPWCSYLHLATRDKLLFSRKVIKMLEDAA